MCVALEHKKKRGRDEGGSSSLAPRQGSGEEGR